MMLVRACIVLLFITNTVKVYSQDFKPNHIEGRWRGQVKEASELIYFDIQIKGNQGVVVSPTNMVSKMVGGTIYDSIQYDGGGVWSAIRFEWATTGGIEKAYWKRKYPIKLTISADKYMLKESSGDLSMERKSPYSGEQEDIEKIIRSLPACPLAPESKFFNICMLIERQDGKYQSLLEEIACVDPKEDNLLVVKAKVQRLWNTHYKEFSCESTGFPVEFGNVLKFSVFQNFTLVIDQLIGKYGLGGFCNRAAHAARGSIATQRESTSATSLPRFQ